LIEFSPDQVPVSGSKLLLKRLVDMDDFMGET
jgi:hypothetical protein